MYARVTHYEVRPDKVKEAQGLFREAHAIVRKVPGLKSFTNVMREDGKGLILALYENKAAAGAAAPQVREYWMRFTAVLAAPPMLEDYATVLAPQPR
jgi:quinol monooxygenase YgiN